MLCRSVLPFASIFVMAACGPFGETKRPEVAASPAPDLTYADRCQDTGVDERGDLATSYTVRGAKSGPFRSVARVRVADGSLCSAVLISPRRLISAAHCFEAARSPEAVEFADTVLDLPVSLPVLRIDLHPVYAAALKQGWSLATDPELAGSDLAMITLVAPVEGRGPIVTAVGDDLQRGRLVSLVGYGDAGAGSGTKRFVQSHVGRRVVEEQKNGRVFRDLLLLDSLSGGGACPGDSGGGVFVREGNGYALVGVVSGVNDLLYPGLPIGSCTSCPQGLGIVTMLSGHAEFLARY